jgi:hypothetical protein
MKFLSNNIPVFLHIPKNAGTFVISALMDIFRYYGTTQNWNNEYGWNIRLRRIHVETKNKTVLTLFAYDADNIRLTHPCLKQSKEDPYVTIVDLNDFYNNFKTITLGLFAVIIESDGVALLQEKILPLLENIITPQVNYRYYLLLRDPLSRAHSMFCYILSENSKHECTHNALKSLTFEEYITSYEVEDSWIIRTFLNLPLEHIITDEDFKQTCLFLNKFKIAEVSKAYQLLEEMVDVCYNVNLQNIPNTFLTDLRKNKTDNSNNQIVIKDNNSIVKFTIRTYYDYRLYQHFIGHC